MSRLCLVVALLGATRSWAADAQQQMMPPAGALKAIEPAKVAKPPLAAGKVADRLALVGKDDDLYRGLNLTPAQSAQLKANLSQLRCLPPGAPIPAGHTMMQIMPTGGSLGVPGGAADACMNDSIDATQLASLRGFLRAELKRRNADLAQFDKGIPKDCAFGEMQYYLAIVAQF